MIIEKKEGLLKEKKSKIKTLTSENRNKNK